MSAAHQAERALVGMVLVEPNELANVQLRPDDFDHPGWRRCWEVMQAMDTQGIAITTDTLAAELERRQWTAIDLADAVSHSAGPWAADSYSRVVREGAITRRAQRAAAEVLAAADKGVHGSELASLLAAKAAEVDASAGGDQAARGIGSVVKDRFAEVGRVADARANGEELTTGVPTGIKALDGLLGGVQRGIVTVLAGRPGMGKSAAAMAITDAATRAGRGVDVKSLEDQRSAYCDRALSRIARIPGERIRTAQLSRNDLTDLGKAAQDLYSREGWIVDDRGGLSASEIIRSYRCNLRDNRTELVVVDYLQLMAGCYGDDATREIERAMTQLSDAAKADNVAIVVLSQLNRSLENRDDRRPRLSDLRQSGAIEERAKCVIFLYRPSVYEPAPEDLIELIVAKNNHGRTGTVTANWDGPTTRIY